MRGLRLLGALLALASCAAAPAAPPEAQAARRAGGVALPEMRGFRAEAPRMPARSDASLARDFLDLSFRMESGRALPVLTRFEGPIDLAVTGLAAPTLEHDLAALLGRLSREAGIEIARAPAGARASITIETVPAEDLAATVPLAACFVVPRVSSWAEYRRARGGALTDWTTLLTRERVAIFVPSGIPPQELRDCLHEELAQALGPLNDLWRLTDSVFNDDNFQAVLTPFDMAMLRITYAPELASGMSEAEVAARLPAILERIGDHGASAPAPPPGEADRAYGSAIEAALGGPTAGARAQAARAAGIAAEAGWRDARLPFALYALGRLSLAEDPGAATEAFEAAERLYAAEPAMRVHAAHAGMQLAAAALATGEPSRAAAIARSHAPAAAAAQNAALYATLRMIEAEALEAQGRAREGEAARLDSLAWARYGFGAPEAVRARLGEIAALAPMRVASAAEGRTP